jgi:hypothetical protein
VRNVLHFLTSKTTGLPSLAGLASFTTAAFLTDIRLGFVILGIGFILADVMRGSSDSFRNTGRL